MEGRTLQFRICLDRIMYWKNKYYAFSEPLTIVILTRAVLRIKLIMTFSMLENFGSRVSKHLDTFSLA